MGALKQAAGLGLAATAKIGIDRTKRLIEIESTKKYVEAVQLGRTAWLSILGTQLALTLGSLSCLVFVGTVLYLLPVSLLTKLIIAASLSFLCMGVCFAVFLYMNSEKRWMEFSHANQMIDRALGQAERRKVYE